MPLGNSIYRVLVQMVDGLWVYDDAMFGVKAQPLVFGMDLILEVVRAINFAKRKA